MQQQYQPYRHEHAACGQNLSGRPYLSGYADGKVFVLSDVYITRVERHSCITALHSICDGADRILGYLAADFYLKDLPSYKKPLKYPPFGARSRATPPFARAFSSSNESVLPWT